MDKKCVHMGVWCILMLMLIGISNSDIAKDRAECATELVGLATCLPYVGGTARAPTPDCCTGLRQVLQNSKKCLCILVRDRDDPSLGFKINSTLALSLPDQCHAPLNISECADLLHLAPNSPEARVFDDFARSANGSHTGNPNTNVMGNSNNNGSTSAEATNDGGKRKGWLGVEMPWALFNFLFINMALLFLNY